ncbi:SH3 domain-containing protein [Roseisalinus antarcticus]|uniref:Bacterial SH3 domain protein n=1 Tax=Roseisalinus antarcticus TaxID=254357 RepID=A0A1Y5SUT3_9RHOB|nr:SH3 domain-containing protein [Roseisalinus antarcticus]SLN45504.1 Bacterial SH3 domain protein [Roseisalinus antarcticus]
MLETRPDTRTVAAAPAAPLADPDKIAEDSDVGVTRAATRPLVTTAPADGTATQARFLRPPEPATASAESEEPAAEPAPRWTSGADAVTEALQIATEQTPQPGQRIVYVNGSKVNVRTGPGTDYGIMLQLERGQDVRLLDTRGGWAEIEMPNGSTGWTADFLLDGL